MQKDKKAVAPAENIIFETQQEDGSSQAVSQKPYQDQSLMKRDTHDKSGTTPVSYDHHDK
jgi:hypothetical protein